MVTCLNLCQFNIGLGLGYSAISLPQLKKDPNYNWDTTADAVFGKIFNVPQKSNNQKRTFFQLLSYRWAKFVEAF